MSIDDLIARAEISDVLARYCRAIDRGDAEMLQSVYHADATDEHGAFSGLARDFAHEIVRKMGETGVVSQHHITNSLVELDGETAAVESYFFAFSPSKWPDEDGPTVGLIGGRYLDRFTRKDGRWAIAHRQVVVDFARKTVPGDPWPGATAYPAGGRGEADPSRGFFPSEN